MIHFPNLLGNERLKSTFATIPANKLGSAIVFEGPQGIGKVTAATDLASALLCSGENRPCGVCPSCRRMKAGTNSDFELFGDGDTTPKIEDVRALRSRSFIRSGEAGFKAFIIANADKLNAQSQNALLKVLEEPLNTVFILTCENSMDLLQTVRSRCTIYHLEPLDTETIICKLKSIPGYTDDDRTYAAKISGGSLENAINILQNGESAANKVAHQFLQAIGDELATFRAASLAGNLSRTEYLTFCNILSPLIAEMLISRDDSIALISIYEFIQSQISILMSPQNPSISALSGALAAFCGDIYGGK